MCRTGIRGSEENPRQQCNVKKCCITNAPDGSKDSTVWKNTDLESSRNLEELDVNVMKF